MFIALVGLPLSGKDAIADWLVSHNDFRRVSIDSRAAEPETEDPIASTSASSSTSPLVFPSAHSLLNNATKSWRSNLVTTDLQTTDDLDEFLKRPFFLLAGVEAGAMVRWQRALFRNSDLPANSLEAFQSFLAEHDALLYSAPTPPPLSASTTSLLASAPSAPPPSSSAPPPLPPTRSLSTLSIDPNASPQPEGVPPPTALHDLFALANLRIVNNYPSLEDLYAHLDALRLDDTERVRPSWDNYFMTLASLASLRSNCMKRRVGAILVREKRIVSTGYNGTPRGMRNCNEGGCGRCNRGEARGGGLNLCVCLHAEENALLEAGRERVGQTATLYCNTCPCLPCAVKIVQSGVKEVVYNLAYAMDEESARVLKEGGVELRRWRGIQ